MRWFIVRGPSRSLEVVAEDDVGEDAGYILFPCTCAVNCLGGVHKVHKAHVGSTYFRTPREAEERANRFRPNAACKCESISKLPNEVICFNPRNPEEVDALLHKFGPEGVSEIAQVLLAAAYSDMDGLAE